MNNLKSKREAIGMSQVDLAKKASCSRSFLSACEHGDKKMTLKMAVRLSAILHCEPGDLLGGDSIRYGDLPITDQLKAVLASQESNYYGYEKPSTMAPREKDIFMIVNHISGQKLTDDEIHILLSMADALYKKHTEEGK